MSPLRSFHRVLALSGLLIASAGVQAQPGTWFMVSHNDPAAPKCLKLEDDPLSAIERMHGNSTMRVIHNGPSNGMKLVAVEVQTPQGQVVERFTDDEVGCMIMLDQQAKNGPMPLPGKAPAPSKPARPAKPPAVAQAPAPTRPAPVASAAPPAPAPKPPEASPPQEPPPPPVAVPSPFKLTHLDAESIRYQDKTATCYDNDGTCLTAMRQVLTYKGHQVCTEEIMIGYQGRTATNISCRVLPSMAAMLDEEMRSMAGRPAETTKGVFRIRSDHRIWLLKEHEMQLVRWSGLNVRGEPLNRITLAVKVR